jgi:clusterin-associated protein 1
LNLTNGSIGIIPMTYREVKQFTGIVRTLGYPNMVGIDSFDVPNFGLMADLLQWLSVLYDPDIVVLPELSSEHGRVEFIRTIVQQLAIRSGIRLNPRKLYVSDRFAVRELLKLASPIYRGVCSADQPVTSDSKTRTASARISDLSASIPKRVVDLNDQLENELTVRETRTQVLSSMPPLDEVEKSVRAAVDAAGTRLEQLTKQLEQLKSDEETFKSKIKARKHELERQSKRLVSVQTLRPAYMDEYEGLEQELQELFKQHFQHYRTVDYYEHELQLAAEKQRRRRAEADKFIIKMKSKAATTIANQVQQSFQPIAGTIAGAFDSIKDLPNVADDPGTDDSF